MLQNKLPAYLILMLGITFAAVLFAQSAKSAHEGVYTNAQAEQGHALYTQQCAIATASNCRDQARIHR